MLQIKDICKEYKTGNLIQKALDHVSLNLRNNEFVAILGPSGSGKTTLLNIIGGLDRYDSGDLIINDISTKRYTDRDWDSYRNHTIGFVFQSYNLIPHQTVLANVELALTISGISGVERRRRATEALEKVGLGEQLHKKPAQMSGGQMQRVAIARALVNDPDILLADEPTGALDSDTSVTIMELLKEVASDRLVVMVTHNPELAEQYATRIVNLKDGHIMGDSDPFEPETEEEEPMHKNMGKSSMSFLTALSLSFNNLRTKLTRTLLVAFAGSIGIIGIALIISLSNGVNQYIKDIEEETLLQYPLEIQNASVSLSSFVEVPEQDEEEKEAADVTERRIASSMFSRVSNNDLGALKRYFESDESHIMDYAKAIEYTYNVTPLIYRMEGDTARQVNPDTSFASLGFSSSSLVFSSAFNTDIFRAFPKDESLYKDSYDLKAGKWAENYNECMLVISTSGKITDTVLYTLGLKDADELTRMMEAFSAGETVKEEEGPLQEYRFEDFVGISFKLVNSYEKYVYDGEYDVWTDKSEDKNYINKLAKNGEDLVITGVLQAKEDATVAMLMPGIYYPESLTRHVIEESYKSQITGSQLMHTNIDVFTGKAFNAPRDEKDGLNLETLFTVDRNALSKVFSFDSSKLSMDTTAFENLDMSDMNVEGMIDSSALEKAMPDMSSINLQEILASADLMNNVDFSKLSPILTELSRGYLKQYGPKLYSFDQFFQMYLDNEYRLVKESGSDVIKRHVRAMVVKSAEETITTPLMSDFVKTIMEGFPAVVVNNISTQGEEAITEDEIKEWQTQYINDNADAISQAITDLVVYEIKKKEIPAGEIRALTDELLGGYDAYAEAFNKTESPIKAPTTEEINNSYSAYLRSDEAQAIISKGIASAVNTQQVEKNISKSVSKVTGEITDGITKGITNMMTSFMTKFTEELTKKISTAIQDGMGNMAENMNSAFSIHPEAFANAISMNMDEQELSELLTSLMSTQPASYDSNLKLLGYADIKKPYSITIYPKDFEAKSGILNILDSYNERMREEDEDKVITYTDTVGLLMTSVTDIINAISYVLIAFVAISLIVSSIMIGVITYISVLERRKEIGILRAIGASKRNISSVFNAETFIIGLLAGLFGIGISSLLLIPGNMLIRHFTDANVRAALPFSSAVSLVLLSVILTLIGGILPSRKAARSDPVAALRSE